jgi:hypothetical protein
MLRLAFFFDKSFEMSATGYFDTHFPKNVLEQLFDASRNIMAQIEREVCRT